MKATGFRWRAKITCFTPQSRSGTARNTDIRLCQNKNLVEAIFVLIIGPENCVILVQKGLRHLHLVENGFGAILVCKTVYILSIMTWNRVHCIVLNP